MKGTLLLLSSLILLGCKDTVSPIEPIETEQSIVAFIDEYKRQLREISLRTVLKIADLAKAFPENWPQMATSTVLKPQ